VNAAAALLWVLAARAPVDAGPRPIEPVEVDVDGGVDVASDGGSGDAGAVGDADAGPVGWSVQARVEPAAVPFGGEVQLVVVVTRPPKARIAVPDDVGAKEELPRTAQPPRREARELQDGRIEETLRFGFLALDVKDSTTPRFTLTVTTDGDADGGDVLEVPALPVKILVEPLPDPSDGGVPDGALQLEPAAGVILYRVDDPRPWALLALLVVVAVVVVVVRAAIRARALTAPVVVGPPPPPPRPAHEVALERLDALMPLLAAGDVTAFVERLMDEVLRDYLAARFALAAGTRTTKEIVTDLLSIAAVNLDVTLVERVGQDADLVKFARASLAAEQAHAMAGRVRALILATATTTTTTTPSTMTTTASPPTSTEPPR
jgi:hypothetical protein